MATEVDYNSIFDHLSIFAPILLIFVTCLTVFHRLKARWPVKVNCWFCNENSKIWRQHLDWWLCPWCQQYNGFSRNGDYMYDIPEQYKTSNSFTRYCKLSNQSDIHHVPKSNLCTYCNEKENLKLLELSNFEPKSEKRYDLELKAFKKYLEERYPLCENCKLMVQSVLSKQAQWLTRYKMLFFRRKPIKALGNVRKLGAICQVISVILVLVVAYNPDYIWLPIIGLFFHLYACWASTRKRRNYDVLLIFLWLLIIGFISIKNLKISRNVWLTTERIAQCHMITICAFIVTFMSSKSNLYKNTLTVSVAFKKLKSNSRDVATSQSIYNNQSENNNVSNEMNDSSESSVSVTGELCSTEMKSHSAILKQKLSTIAADNSNDRYPSSVSRNNPQNGYCLNDSLSTLFLSEGTSRCGRNARATPAIFERKVYSATSSENLFRRSGNAFNRRCILSPPKLRSVTQASWVAGGYWQEGMMTATPPTLSRSSSQSSGFGSAGSSNLAPSREPSVHELDRCSVVSDATRWSCRTTRPSPSNIARHGSPIPVRRRDATWNHTWFPPSPTFPVTRGADSHIPEYPVSRSNAENPSDLVSTFRDHHAMPATTTTTTTTIVATPIWLSALLCGSLILNMIVLCTMVSR